MLIKIITWATNNRLAVIAFAVVLGFAGMYSLSRLNIDAFPDTTPVQIQINTVAPALVATEVERLITVPVETSMGGMNGLEDVRSLSQFGLSQVTLTFEDGTDIYKARAVVAERLSTLRIPDGIPKPEMGPVATGLGEVLHYLVIADPKKPMSLTDLRTTQGWVIRPELRRVPGAAEVNSWGGLEKQYQVRIDPDMLLKYSLTFQDVLDAAQHNNLNVGGGYLDRNGDMLLIHGIGRTATVPQIEGIVVASRNGTAVYLKDVAEIAVSHEIRRGIVTAAGEGEAVLGLGFMRVGESSYDVTRKMRARLDELAKGLPPGAKIECVYDRTDLVDQVINTVRENLLEGALLVVLILYMFLGNLRAGLICAVAIPLSMLFAFCGMYPAGISGTLLSLGAIDFGIVVDSSVVVLENIIRRLAEAEHHGNPEKRTRIEIIRDAAAEVRKPAVFGQLIVLIVYLPILSLEGVEGKMFRPMALTVMLVLTGSLILALTLTPVLASYLLPKKIEEKEVALVRGAKALYSPMLRWALRRPWLTVGVGLFALFLAGLAVKDFGGEFVPQLSEGSIVVGVLRAPGTSLEQSAEMNRALEKHIRANYPDEVKQVWSRVGEPEINTDSGSPESTDMFVSLHPRSKWKKAKTQTELVEVLSKDLKRFRGQEIWFTQPIEMRLNEMLTGSRSDLSLKLFGSDIDTLIAKSRELEAILRTIPGCADLAIEQVAGQPILQVKVKPEQLARYGISARQVLDVVEAVAGKAVGDVMEDQIRFPLAVKIAPKRAQSADELQAILIPAPNGEQIPLGRLADVQEVRGPKLITSEWGKRRIALQCNVRGRDIASFVAEAQARIDQDFKLPEAGYRLEWGGQFENMQRAQTRLMIVVPAALGLIVLLLYLTYRDARATLVVFASVPFACIGGIAAMWLREMPFSVSAAVGFITLSGVSVLNSMIVVSYLRGPAMAGLSVREAIEATSLTCFRTVLMTAAVASVGFIPMAFNSGTGAEVQRPLATVVIGGVISSTAMTALLLPALYSLLFSTKPKKELGPQELEA
jgi:cobalt-zinc-cadmium resistance protein CzcA